MLQPAKSLAAGITNFDHKFNLKILIGESHVVTSLKIWMKKGIFLENYEKGE